MKGAFSILREFIESCKHEEGPTVKKGSKRRTSLRRHHYKKKNEKVVAPKKVSESSGTDVYAVADIVRKEVQKHLPGSDGFDVIVSKVTKMGHSKADAVKLINSAARLLGDYRGFSDYVNDLINAYDD